MRRALLVVLMLLGLRHAVWAAPIPLSPEDAANIACLRSVYPELVGVSEDAQAIWLHLANGSRVLYGKKGEDTAAEGLSVDVRTSMRDPYWLDPIRPETPPGTSPGRKRSYDLLRALYGNSPAEVQAKLITVTAFGQKWTFPPRVATAFVAAARELEASVRADPMLAPWLVNDGTFVWRKIAGEEVLSAHAFGIAFDCGVKQGATYWRWSKLRPHPLQKTYAPLLVSAFEKAGFIWGGKWHEYDLMHYEYRPELICKAKRRRHFDTDVLESTPRVDRP